jgi:hypothetical protein
MPGTAEHGRLVLHASQWLNGGPLPPEALHGRVTLLYAFQMLCPACVHHATPQMQRLQAALRDDPRFVLIGLHSVFEHHAVMTPAALAVYIHENRLTFPIAVDAPEPEGGPVPRTMAALHLRGTPSLLLADAEGRIRAHHFGAVDDLALGLELGALLAQTPVA